MALRIKFRSENLESFVERYGADVSPGGIFIRSRQPLTVGTKVSFTLSLLNGIPVLVGEGTVAWSRQPEGDRPGGNPGMGIRFDLLNDESRMKLNRILEAKTAHDKAGKPSVRGPTPIPEDPGVPVSAAALTAAASEATAKVRLTTDGRIVRDLPAPAEAPASRPRSISPGFGDAEPTRLTAPPVEALRRSTPPSGAPVDKGFGPSATLAGPGTPSTQGGEAIRPPPAQAREVKRSPTPVFGAPRPRPAGGGGFASTVAFGAEATRARPGTPALPGEPTRGGVTPGPDLLLRATPPPVAVASPSSVFSRPTPVPSGPITTGRSGPVVNRPTGTRPAEPGTSALPKVGGAGAWSSDQTEIVEDVPNFDDLDDKSARAHEPPGAGSVSGEPAGASPQTSETGMPALTNLFEDEMLPGLGDAAPLVSGPDAGTAFGVVESTGRGRGASPAGPAPGTSMVARRAELTEPGTRRRRGVLWMVLGAVAVGAAVFTFVELSGPGGTREVTPVAVPTPEPVVEAPSEAPVAEAPPTPEETPAPADPKPSPKLAVAEDPAPKPQVEKPAPRAPAKPVREAPRAAGTVVSSAPIIDDTLDEPAGETAGDEATAIRWLRVRSVPAGAEVFIDGESEGQTPFQRRIFDATRPYALSVRKEGYEPYERLLSSSDPWVKARGEFILTVTVKLRRVAPVPAEGTPAPVEGEPAPSAPPAPAL